MVIHNYSRFTDGAFEQLASFPKILELIIYNESITGDKNRNSKSYEKPSND